MFLSGDSQEDTNGATSLLFFVLFSSPVDSIQALSIISFSRFKCLLMSMHRLIIHLSLFIIHLFRSAKDISEDLCLHYQDPFKLFGDYYLIQVI